MARQGSLCLLTIRLGCGRAVLGSLCAIVCGCALLITCANAEDTFASRKIDTKIRLQWPSSAMQQEWIRIELVDDPAANIRPGLSDIKNFSNSPFATGAYTFREHDKVVLFRPRGALKDGAVEFRVRATVDAKLKLRIADRSKFKTADQCLRSMTSGPSEVIPITDLLAGDTHQASRVAVTRVSNDELRIGFDQPSPVFRPRSTVQVRMRANSLTVRSGQTEQLSAQIYRVADNAMVGQQAWTMTIDPDGNSDETSWQLEVPSRPGVYELRCQLKQPESLIWSKLRRKDPPVVRTSIPFVVIDDSQNADSVDARGWREIARIRPIEDQSVRLNQWIAGSTARLNPLASPSSQSENEVELDRGEHAGQPTSLIRARDQFISVIPTLSPGLPQQLTIRYPTGRSMRLRVEVLTGIGQASACDFVLTEEKRADASDPWSQHTFVYYPGAGESRIRLTNLSEGNSAMIESVSIKAGPSRIRPSHTSRVDREVMGERLAIYSLTQMNWVDSFTHDIDPARDFPSYLPQTIAMHRLMVATERLRNYVTTQGMNAVVIPALADQRAWVKTASLFPSHAEANDDEIKLQIVMQALESSQLSVFAGIDASTSLTEVESFAFEQVKSSGGVLRAIDARRSEAERAGSKSCQYNPLHSKVGAAMVSLTEQVDAQLRNYEHYTGIVFQSSHDNHLSLSGDPSKCEDFLLEEFAASKSFPGHTSAVAPARVRAWVSGEGKKVFGSWKVNQLCKLYHSLSSRCDGKTVVVVDTNGAASHELGEMMKQVSATHAGDAAKNKLAIAWNVRRVPIGSLPRRLPLDWASPLAAKDSGTNAVAYGFCIGDSRFGDARVDHAHTGSSLGVDVAPRSTLRGRTTADVSKILEQTDPQFLMFNGSDHVATLNPELTELLRNWVELPIDSLDLVETPDPSAATVRLRFGRSGNDYYLVAINLAPWDSNLAVQTSTALNWDIAGSSDIADERQLAVLENDGLRMRLSLPPQRFVVLRAGSARDDVRILDWYSQVRGGKPQVEKITAQVSTIVDRLGGLSDPSTYPSLTNGGFESHGNVGLAGWMHAQHPTGAVRIDDTESIEGKRSVRLTTDRNVGDRTWIVSEMIQPPRSGRLAVSLACRAQLYEAGSSHRLRVSIEGTRLGEPIRRSEEIEIPRNGQWRTKQMVLEIEGVDPSSVDSLRLTIDSLTPGRVWIDDIRLHDWFPVSKERSELQGEAYVAVQGLQRGNLTPAARLIQNEWAQYLLTIDEPSPPDVIETSDAEEAPAGVAERLRSWLPRPLRF